MTTGNSLLGSTTGPFFFQKTWSGTDGYSSPVVVSTRRFFFRKLIAAKVIKRIVVKNRDGKYVIKKLVTPPRYDLTFVDKVRHFRPKVVRTINAYHVLVRQANSTKGWDPTYGDYISTAASFDSGSFLWNSNDEGKILDNLANQVKGHQFNLGVALGEGREAAEMVLHSLHRILGGIRAIKKGRIDLALRHLGVVPYGKYGQRARPPGALTSKDVSGMWLEIQYGWRPLLSDVYESMKAYSAITDKERSMRFKATHSKRTTVTSCPSGCSNYSMVQNIILSKQIIYEATEQISNSRSLGLVDPRAVAWELVPFSFVADWFIPIGTYLDNLAIIPKLTGRFCTTYRIAIQAKGVGSPSSWSYNGAKFSSSMKDVTRSFSTSIPVPRPEFVPIGDVLSIGRIKNSIALLHQIVT